MCLPLTKLSASAPNAGKESERASANVARTGTLRRMLIMGGLSRSVTDLCTLPVIRKWGAKASPARDYSAWPGHNIEILEEKWRGLADRGAAALPGGSLWQVPPVIPRSQLLSVRRRGGVRGAGVFPNYPERWTTPPAAVPPFSKKVVINQGLLPPAAPSRGLW